MTRAPVHRDSPQNGGAGQDGMRKMSCFSAVKCHAQEGTDVALSEWTSWRLALSWGRLCAREEGEPEAGPLLGRQTPLANKPISLATTRLCPQRGPQAAGHRLTWCSVGRARGTPSLGLSGSLQGLAGETPAQGGWKYSITL